MDWLDKLYATLDKRATTEQVAAIINHAPVSARLGVYERELLAEIVRPGRHDSFMLDDFARPRDAVGPLLAVRRMFPDHAEWPSPQDTTGMLRLVDDLGEDFGWDISSDWKDDRLPHDVLQAMGIKRRQYNRKIRALRHLTGKATRLQAATDHRRMILVGRSGFACDISRERFRADRDAAMFIAYWIARKNRRRLFSLSGKENPMDHLAAALLDRCTRKGHAADWPMIASVYTNPPALRWLSPGQLGELAGAWSGVMRQAADGLRREWQTWAGAAVSRRDQMIVRRGMNSSGWNELAQAYNAARTGWLNATVAISPALIAPYLPGKVMRLMAADLAAWYRGTGGGVDPDTRVWSLLPLPWAVLDGTADCGQFLVERQCRNAGIDPAARGWTAPHATREIAAFAPTPELVHGVQVSDPLWAAALRRAGVFAGPSKKAAPDAMSLRLAAEDAGVITGRLPTREEVAAGYDPAVQ